MKLSTLREVTAMKIEKMQFASVTVDDKFQKRVAVYAYDETNKRYLLIRSWLEGRIVDSDDLELVQESVDEKTFIEVNDYINEINSAVSKALRRVI
jgi:hypothetical protein